MASHGKSRQSSREAFAGKVRDSPRLPGECEKIATKSFVIRSKITSRHISPFYPNHHRHMMESLNLNTLANSLPTANAEKDLLNNFKGL